MQEGAPCKTASPLSSLQSIRDGAPKLALPYHARFGRAVRPGFPPSRINLTLNTLCSDREMAQAVDCAVQASQLGADAVLVQDMGLVRSLRQCAPDLPLHASTQMTLHSLDGVKQAAERDGPPATCP